MPAVAPALLHLNYHRADQAPKARCTLQRCWINLRAPQQVAPAVHVQVVFCSPAVALQCRLDLRLSLLDCLCKLHPRVVLAAAAPGRLCLAFL